MLVTDIKLKKFVIKLDLILAYFGLLVGILLILITKSLNIEYLGAGLTVTISCTLYILLKNNTSNEIYNEKLLQIKKETNLYFFRSMDILFICIYTLSVVVLYFYLYERPLSYFILIITACILISVEIVSNLKYNKKRDVLILTKIIMIALNLRAGLYYEFPGLYASDPYTWVEYCRYTLETGQIVPNSTYTYYPIMNLELAITSLLSNLNLKNTMFFSLGFFEILGITYIYLVGKIVSNSTVGLLGSLMLGISQTHIRMGVVIFQSTLGLGLYSLIFYVLFRKNNLKDVRISALLVFLVIVLTISHHLSSMTLLLSLIFILVGECVYDLLYKKSILITDNLFLVILTSICIISYWIYNGSWQFEFAIKSLSAIILDTTRNQVEALAVPVQYNAIIAELKQIGIYLYLFLFIIGGLYWLNYTKIDKLKMMLLFGGALLTFSTFAFIIAGYKEIAVNRWFPFVYTLISIPAAQGLLCIVNDLKSNGKMISFILFISIFSTVMITSGMEDIERPLYAEPVVFHRYLTSDLITADTIIPFCNNSTLITDFRYRYYLKASGVYNSGWIQEKLDIKEKEIWIIREDYLNNYAEMALFHTGYNETNTIRKFNGTALSDKAAKKSNKIYNSDMIKMYEL